MSEQQNGQRATSTSAMDLLAQMSQPGGAAPRITRHTGGVSAVDADYIRPGLVASHVIQHAGRAAFVDVGSNHSVPFLLAALAELGQAPADVDYLILTHVHLDHAGGAGELMRHLPHARAVMHPRGAPHLIDPAKLIAATRAVYGDAAYQQLYGDIAAIPAERVVLTEDGHKLSLGGRELEFLHTPGHALHHQAIVDRYSGGIFTGDTFGLSYREFDTERGAFIIPTTTPTQFDPDQLIASIDRLQALGLDFYLTHYSRVANVPRLAIDLKSQIRAFVEIARRHAGAPQVYERIYEDMRRLWLQLARQQGCQLSDQEIDDLLSGDLNLNTLGLVAWLQRVA